MAITVRPEKGKVVVSHARGPALTVEEMLDLGADTVLILEPVDPVADRQALRDREAEDIRSGAKTAAQVRRERSLRRARRAGKAVRP